MHIPHRYSLEIDDPALFGRFTKWMVTVADHAMIDYLRRLDKLKNETHIEDAPQKELAYDPLQDILQDGGFGFEDESLSASFSRLSQMRRKILIMAFVEQLSSQEIAERLDVPIKYVYNQKHEALRKLRDQLMEGGRRDG
jgi:RNA polymerase sigma factor (sigma-70 family)